jgi:hypothetical protein
MKQNMASIRHRENATSTIPTFLPSKHRSQTLTERNRRLILILSLFIAIVGILKVVNNGISMREMEAPAPISTSENLKRFIQAKPILPNQDTIIGIGADYDIYIYKKFVGSLRKSGFTGNIILGMSDQQYAKNDNYISEIFYYLDAQNVTVKMMRTAQCLFDSSQTCLQENAMLKPAMASYLLVKNWVYECIECNGSVMVASIPNTYFQSVPFDYTAARNYPRDPDGAVHLFEMPLTTEDWRVALHLYQCKKFQWDVPLLSSITIGNRMSILFYLETFIGETYSWDKNGDCRSNLHGQGMAIHNYLFYNGDYRAKVHEYEKSSGLVTFATNEEFGKWNMDDAAGSSSPIVISLDENGPGDEFYTWIGEKEDDRKQRLSIGSVHLSHLRSMPMEYYSPTDRENMSNFKLGR